MKDEAIVISSTFVTLDIIYLSPLAGMNTSMDFLNSNIYSLEYYVLHIHIYYAKTYTYLHKFQNFCYISQV